MPFLAIILSSNVLSFILSAPGYNAPSLCQHRVHSLYGLIVVILTSGLDAPIILFLKRVLGIASEPRGSKPSTPTSLTSLLYSSHQCHHDLQIWEHLPSIEHMLMANIYLLPAVLSPIVYSVKNKQIRGRVMRMFQGRKSRA